MSQLRCSVYGSACASHSWALVTATRYPQPGLQLTLGQRRIMACCTSYDATTAAACDDDGATGAQHARWRPAESVHG
jgi:hypothetical protein